MKNKQNKSIRKKIGLALIVLAFSLSSATIVLATGDTAGAQTGNTSAQTVNSSSQSLSGAIRSVGGSTTLPSYDAGHASQNYHAGASQITSIIYFALDFLKYIVGGIAALMIVISGLKLVISARGVAEATSREKETLRYSSNGLVLIIIADQLIRKVFFGEEGEVYRTGTDLQAAAESSNAIAAGAVNLIRIFLPYVAILFIVIAAVRLITSRGEADQMNKAKTQMTWTIVGLVLAGIAEIIITKIVFPNNGTQLSDTQELAKFLVMMTNFIAGFMSTAAVTMLIYAGYLYVISVGGEGVAKAKKIVTAAIIGLFIAMAGFGLVNTFVKIEPPKTDATTQNNAIPDTSTATTN